MIIEEYIGGNNDAKESSKADILGAEPSFEEKKIMDYKRYREETCENGIEMPTKEVFDKKMKMAVETFPQKDKDGKVNYLFGKGVGVELALRGEVLGREKNNMNFPYRSHSDFEIYNYDGDYSAAGIKDFYEIFGAQEIYPKDRTKRLKNIPEGYMDETCDTVMYDGGEYLIPELEILFLDKYLGQETTPREEGCDAVLLAKEYDLDADKVLRYYDKFVAESALDTINKQNSDEQLQRTKEIVVKKLKDALASAEVDFAENGVVKTASLLSDYLNNWVNSMRRAAYFEYMPAEIVVEEAGDGSFKVGEDCLDLIGPSIVQGNENKRKQVFEKRKEIEELLKK